MALFSTFDLSPLAYVRFFAIPLPLPPGSTPKGTSLAYNQSFLVNIPFMAS